MSLKADITPEREFLSVHVTGEFSPDEGNGCLVGIFEALAQHGLQRVLVDCRQVIGEPTTMERFALATFAVRELDRYADLGVFRGTQIAFVGHEPLVDKDRFGETVAVNRGLNVKVTLSLQRAFRWLEIDPPKGTVDTSEK